MWGLAAGGAIAIGLVWVLASDSKQEAAANGAEPEASEGVKPDGGDPVADPNAPSRVLEVLVEGCRGPAADALVFVKVDEELVSGTTDPHGKARIKAKPGPAEVRARVAGWEGIAAAGADQASVVVRSCRGAEVKGHIIYSGTRTPAEGVTVKLLDGSGQTIDEVESDFYGAYRLSDPELEASAVVAEAGGDGEGTEEELAPLRSGEVRELDIALGTTFELVGWVVDVRGDPVSGVSVTIAAENAGVSWRGVTDQGGGFRFARAPLQALALTADGGDLGLVSRRVVPFDERRMDVTLVLEPTGTLIVLTPPGVRGQVLLKNWSSPLIHGAMPEPSPEEYYPPPHGGDEVEPPAETAAVEPELERMNGILTKALADYDDSDPVESLVRFLGHMREGMPELEQTLRGELSQLAPGEDKTFEELARLAAKKLVETDPSALDAFRIAAEKVRGGMNGVEALMASSEEMNARKQAETEALPEQVDPGLGIESSEGEVPAELSPVDEVPLEEYPMAEPAIEPPVSPLFKRLSEQFGGLAFPYFDDEAGVVGRGAAGEEVRVPGAFRYNVVLVLEESDPDGTRYAVGCGEVLIPAGRTIEMFCGLETAAVLTGKVVDTRGRPVEGARVFFDGTEKTETDRFGAWTVSYTTRTAYPCSVLVTKEGAIDEQWRPSERINLQCVPGGTTEVAPIVLRREEEAPLLLPDEPFGGVGGSLEQGQEGVVLAGIRPDGPLALDGIDEYSTILKVNDEDATSWPVEEMLARLRGDVGTHVQLQVRGPDGELIETTIERALVTP